MPPVRKKFELLPRGRYALDIASVHKNVDIVFVRELTEACSARDRHRRRSIPAERRHHGFHARDHAQGGTAPREAFEIASTRARRKVTAAHKEPVYRLACGMFAEECRKVAREFPQVAFEEMMIDSIAMKLVMEPQRFDVVVTTNQFGDILTDIGAGLVGGLGLAPGLCVGAAGDRRRSRPTSRARHRQSW
jgi:3-isopropylmalate dehydrogenase